MHGLINLSSMCQSFTITPHTQQGLLQITDCQVDCAGTWVRESWSLLLRSGRQFLGPDSDLLTPPCSYEPTSLPFSTFLWPQLVPTINFVRALVQILARHAVKAGALTEIHTLAVVLSSCPQGQVGPGCDSQGSDRKDTAL